MLINWINEIPQKMRKANNDNLLMNRETIICVKWKLVNNIFLFLFNFSADWSHAAQLNFCVFVNHFVQEILIFCTDFVQSEKVD